MDTGKEARETGFESHNHDLVSLTRGCFRTNLVRTRGFDGNTRGWFPVILIGISFMFDEELSYQLPVELFLSTISGAAVAKESKEFFADLAILFTCLNLDFA